MAIIFRKVLSSISLLIFISCLQTAKDNEVLTYLSENGHWAYKIKLNAKVIIKQEHIPAVNGIQYFKNQEDAFKVGDLVLKKLLKNSKEFPDISINEIDSLQVKY